MLRVPRFPIVFALLAAGSAGVAAGRQLVGDLSITNTDGVTSVIAGRSVTYTITAANAVGSDDVEHVSVNDVFPSQALCAWTCVGTAGGVCAASGSGDIHDTEVQLLAGASVTYTAVCAIPSSAAGELTNWASVSGGGLSVDPGANNLAIDTDSIEIRVDLSASVTDGVAVATAGLPVTYTLVAANAGPSDSPAFFNDVFPAACRSVSWTCLGAAGGSCGDNPSGTGNISFQGVTLPAGGRVTYTAICDLAPTATGSLVNQVFVAPPIPIPDDPFDNNTATDTDTLIPQVTLVSVPALAPMGLLALAVALAALAVGRLRCRFGS